MRYILSLAVACCFFLGCQQEGVYSITGELSVPDGSAISVREENDRHQIAGKSITGGKFDLAVDGVPEGVYDVVVSWKDPNWQQTRMRLGSNLSTPDSLYSGTTLYLEAGQDYQLSSPVKDITKVYAPTSTNLHPFPIVVNTSSENTRNLLSVLTAWERITLQYRKKQDSLNVFIKKYQENEDSNNFHRVIEAYQNLDKDYLEKEKFNVSRKFIETHRSSAISAYLIATAPNLKENKSYYESALKALDPALTENPYVKQAQRRLQLIN